MRRLNPARTIGRDSHKIRKAFTLVELLVVIAIIALLAALLLPSLSKAKASAHSTVCRNHLHQMGFALHMYVDDYKGRYPSAWNIDGVNASPWANELESYYKLKWQDKEYHCPDYRGQITAIGTVAAYLITPLNLWGSYAYNKSGTESYGFVNFSAPHFLGLSGTGGFDRALNDQNHAPLSIIDSHIGTPSAMFAISDARTYFWSPDPKTYGSDGIGPGTDEYEVDPFRHVNGSNFLYCDGHVDLVRRDSFIDPRKNGSNYNNDHEFHEETWGWMTLPSP